MTMILLVPGISFLVISTDPFDNFETDTTRASDSDNDFNFATEIPPITIQSGSLAYQNDRADFYLINLSADAMSGDLAVITLASEETSGIGGIALYDHQRFMITYAFIDFATQPSIERSFTAMSSGRHFIKIFYVNTDFEYNLSYAVSSNSRSLDSDNTNISATQTYDEGSYNGDLNAQNDFFDLYNLDITSGDPYTQGVKLTLTNAQNTALTVHGPNGNVFYESDAYGTGATSEVIRFTATSTGTYRLLVYMTNPTGTMAASTSYSLQVDIEDNIPIDKNQAGRTPKGVNAETKYILNFQSEYDESDVYKLSIGSGKVVTVSVWYDEGNNSGDVDITITPEFLPPIQGPVTLHDDGFWKGAYTNGTTQVGRNYFIEIIRNDFIGNYSVLISLVDDNLLFRDKPMRMNNTNLDFTMDEDTVDDTSLNLFDIFFDPDDPHDSIILSSPSHSSGYGANIDIQIYKNGYVQFKPHPDFNGNETFTFEALDKATNVLQWEVKVTVAPVNDKPILQEIDTEKLTWTQGKEVNITLGVVDIDSDNFTFRTNTTLFEVNNTNHWFVYTPQNADVGKRYFNITVSDGEFESSIEFEVIIKNTNDAPNFISLGTQDADPDGFVNITATEDEWMNFTVEVSDPDRDIGYDDIYFFSLNKTDPEYLRVNSENGNISFKPHQEHVGVFYVGLKVEDGEGGETTQGIRFIVTNKNDDPAVPKITTDDQKDLTVNLSSNEVIDEDGDLVYYEWDFGDGSKDYGRYGNHTYDTPGIYVITLTVTDTNDGMSSAKLSVNVTEPEDSSIYLNSTDPKTDNTLWIVLAIIVFVIILIAVIVTVFVLVTKFTKKPEPPEEIQSPQEGPTAGRMSGVSSGGTTYVAGASAQPSAIDKGISQEVYNQIHDPNAMAMFAQTSQEQAQAGDIQTSSGPAFGEAMPIEEAPQTVSVGSEGPAFGAPMPIDDVPATESTSTGPAFGDPMPIDDMPATESSSQGPAFGAPMPMDDLPEESKPSDGPAFGSSLPME